VSLTHTRCAIADQRLSVPLIKLNDTRNFIDEVSGKQVTWTVTATDSDNVTIRNQDNGSWTSSGDPMDSGIT